MKSEFKFYGHLLLRRIPLMLVVFFAVLGAGIYLALSLPPVYSSAARLVVESAQIPDDLAASTVRTGAQEQLEIIQQRLLTRANLLDLARRHNVYPDLAELTPDEIVARMRGDTTFTSTSGRDRATLMTVRFDARAGQIAANVVNDYVTQILRENVQLRTDTAGDTLAFFQQEVARLGVELDKQSARIIDFQSSNIEALPEGQDYRMTQLGDLQERLTQNRRDIAMLDTQYNGLIALFNSTGRSSENAAPLSATQQRLARLRDELTQVLSVYSETSARVRTLRDQIARLEAAEAQEVANRQQQDAGDGTGAAPSTTKVVTGDAAVDLQLADIDSRRKFLADQVPEIEAQMAKLNSAISATPANTVSLDGMRRDYENIQRQYDEAREGLARAATGEQIELSSKGQRISVIEQATAPTKPTKPNRRLIMAAGGVAGAGLAVGLALLLEMMNRAIRRPSDLVKKLDITPLTTIPYISAPGETTARVSLHVMGTLALGTAILLALYAVHTQYMPLDQLAERIRVRMGV